MQQVIICRNPNNASYPNAVVYVDSITNIHIGYMCGGVSATGKRLLGYIPYALAMELGLASGIHEDKGNDYKICIPKMLNKKEGYGAGYEMCLAQV